MVAVAAVVCAAVMAAATLAARFDAHGAAVLDSITEIYCAECASHRYGAVVQMSQH